MERKSKSILEMARGAFLERADYEMKRIIDNILDPNTIATAKRKMTLTVTFEADDLRKNIGASVQVKTALAPTNPVKTSLYVSGENSDGEPQVVEMTAQTPGQLNIYGEEEPWASLKMLQAQGEAAIPNT